MPDQIRSCPENLRAFGETQGPDTIFIDRVTALRLWFKVAPRVQSCRPQSVWSLRNGYVLSTEPFAGTRFDLGRHF